MNRKKILQRVLTLSSCALLGTLASCDKAPQEVQTPLFTDYNSPVHVSMKFPAKSKIPKTVFSIDNVRKQIYNKVYLPYKATLDSAYLDMVVSSENNITITNETTKKSFDWTPRDTGKINITGGRLRIDITTRSGKESKHIAYEMSLQQYGYDPAKLTWSQSKTRLPMQSAQGKVFSLASADYWMGRHNGSVPALYKITNYQPLSFEAVSATLPATLQPTSITADHIGGLWSVDEQGRLYHSTDAIEWEIVSTANIRVQQVLFDTAIKATNPVELIVVGSHAKDGIYYTYKIKNGVLSEGGTLPSGFPIQDAYTHKYVLSGTLCANVLGGESPNFFFSSDGVHWGTMGYTKSNESVPPARGALFLENNSILYAIGGIEKKESNIYHSIDNGRSWQKIVNIQEQGATFASRSGLSGIIRPINGTEAYFLMGGNIGNEATDEIWVGYLDTEGGIINEVK